MDIEKPGIGTRSGLCGDDGHKQAECGKLDIAYSWQEEMAKSSWSDLVHEVDVESTKNLHLEIFEILILRNGSW